MNRSIRVMEFWITGGLKLCIIPRSLYHCITA